MSQNSETLHPDRTGQTTGQTGQTTGQRLSGRLSEECRQFSRQALRLLAAGESGPSPDRLADRLADLAEACSRAARGLTENGQALVLYRVDPIQPDGSLGHSQPIGEVASPVQADRPTQPDPNGLQQAGDASDALLALARQTIAGPETVTCRQAMLAQPLQLDGCPIGALALSGLGGDAECSDASSALAELGDAFRDAWQALHEQHQRRSAQLQAQEMLDRYENMNTNRTQFLGVLSHELRNPATALTMGLSLLDVVAPDSPQGLRAREIMRNQTMMLVRLLDELQDVTRLERRSMSLNLETVDLAHVAQGAVLEIRDAYFEQDIRLDALLPEQPLRMLGDAARLGDLFRHLLDYALKASPSGSSVRFQMRPDLEGQTAVIEVQDHGRGIAAEEVPLLFQPFALSDHRFDRIRNGLGVGLAIANGVAELHGGKIEASSEGPGLGTRFVVRLPMISASPGQIR